MNVESLCNDNVRVYHDFLSQEECDLLTKWFKEFNYSELPHHAFKFWDQRLMTPSLTTTYEGFENSFSDIIELNDILQKRIKDVLNDYQKADWNTSPFNYIKMWKDSNPMKTDYGNNLEMFYHIDNQDHMVQTIFWGTVIYPNDDYLGGELVYPQYNFQYKPKAGTMVMHEGYTRHGVKKVISGDRFCIPSLITKNGAWNPDPRPTPTLREEDPWHYPAGYNGIRMPSDPIKGFIRVPRPDGTVARLKIRPEQSEGDSSLNKMPGGTKNIK